MKKVFYLLLVLSMLISSAAFGGTPAETPLDFPKGPVTILVPYEPGGAIDISTRLVADYIKQETGATIVIENIAGAAGILCLTALQQRPDDGHTLATITIPSSPYVTRVLSESPPPWNLEEEFYFLGSTQAAPGITGIFVSAESPYKTFPELIRAIQAAPPKSFNIGINGPGSTSDPSVMELQKVFGIELNVIYYPGSADTQTAILTGDCHLGAAAINRQPFQDNPAFRSLTLYAGSLPEEWPVKGIPLMSDFEEELGFKYEDLKYIPQEFGGTWMTVRNSTDPKIKEFWVNVLKKIAERKDFQEQMLRTGSMARFWGPELSLQMHKDWGAAMQAWKDSVAE